MSDAGDDAEQVGLPHPEVFAVSADSKADLELARLIGRTLTLAAQKLGIPQRDVSFDDLCQSIIKRANTPGAKLDSYRAVWAVRAALTP